MICLAIFYRSPNSTELNSNSLDRFILGICEKDAKNFTVLMRDTNRPSKNRENMSTTKDDDSKEFRFLETLRDVILLQHVTESTRIPAGDKRSLNLKAKIKPPLHLLVETELPKPVITSPKMILKECESSF